MNNNRMKLLIVLGAAPLTFYNHGMMVLHNAAMQGVRTTQMTSASSLVRTSLYSQVPSSHQRRPDLALSTRLQSQDRNIKMQRIRDFSSSHNEGITSETNGNWKFGVTFFVGLAAIGGVAYMLDDDSHLRERTVWPEQKLTQEKRSHPLHDSPQKKVRNALQRGDLQELDALLHEIDVQSLPQNIYCDITNAQELEIFIKNGYKPWSWYINWVESLAGRSNYEPSLVKALCSLGLMHKDAYNIGRVVATNNIKLMRCLITDHWLDDVYEKHEILKHVTSTDMLQLLFENNIKPESIDLLIQCDQSNNVPLMQRLFADLKPTRTTLFAHLKCNEEYQVLRNLGFEPIIPDVMKLLQENIEYLSQCYTIQRPYRDHAYRLAIMSKYIENMTQNLKVFIANTPLSEKELNTYYAIIAWDRHRDHEDELSYTTDTLLNTAVFIGDVELVEILLKKGANPNLKTCIWGKHFNAYQLAVFMGNKECARIISLYMLDKK